MVSSVVLPTPRWPNRPMRCGRTRRSVRMVFALAIRVIVVSPTKGQSEQPSYCNSSEQGRYYKGKPLPLFGGDVITRFLNAILIVVPRAPIG